MVSVLNSYVLFFLKRVIWLLALVAGGLLGATCTVYAGQANLTWDASTQPEVAGYMVRYGPTSGNYSTAIDVGKVNAYTVTGLMEGNTYYFSLTAYDVGREESPASNEASARVPYNPPVANFKSDKASSAAPAMIVFTSASEGVITSYYWSFGDGTSSTAQNPTHSYSAVGSYSVSLTVSGPGGSNTITRAGYINVFANAAVIAPVANFSTDRTSSAPGMRILFASTSAGSIDRWQWDFGDGSPLGSGPQSEHIYTRAGLYSVSLTVSGPSGSNTRTKIGYISISTIPSVTAGFFANATSSNPSLPIIFTSTSVGAISSYYWEFGDGTVASGKVVSHLYARPGSYSVSLTVTGANGSDKMTKTNYITVQSATVKPGLVAAYNFDAGQGSSVADLSGNSNVGVVSRATWAANGRFGRALAFNGVDSWVTVNYAPSLDLTRGMTLEAWVYPTAAQSGWRDIIMKEKSSGAVYYLTANSTENFPTTGVFAGGAEQILYGKSTLPIATWSHLAATYDGISQKLFLNGVLVASRNQANPIEISTGPLRIGGDSVWGEYFNGLIDEVRIYRRALSAGEIQADMNTPIAQ